MTEIKKATRGRKAAEIAQGPSADVQALIEQNNKLAEQNARLMDQINQLTLAVVAGREAPKAMAGNDEQASIRLENVIGYAIGFQVTDPRTGQRRSHSLQKKGDFTMLRPSEIGELRESHPSLFEKGYLSAPEFQPDNDNVIRDPAAWLFALDDVYTTNEIVGKITSLPSLYLLFNHIEEQRFSHVDEQGRPHIAGEENGRTLYKLEERKIDPKLLAVEMAVKRRIEELQGVKVNLDK